MKYHQIENGTVTGTFANPQSFPTVEGPDEVAPGWTFDGVTWTPPGIDRTTLILTRAQFGEMLIRRGIKAQVEAAIDAIVDPTERAIMREWFEYAPTVRRVSPKVEALRQTLAISESDADEWFTVAMGYE